jgi:phosphoglycerate dehydrogenase-like enzyme
MRKVKVLVTPRSFGKNSSVPLDMLSEKCDVTINPFGRILTKAELIQLIPDMDAVIIGVDPLDEEVLRHAHQLKVISKYGVGTDNIDLNYAECKGIKVTVTADANKEAVADYTLALMLGAARRMVRIDQECRKLNWEKITAVDVWNKTIGLIGLGSIGKGVAARAQGFNMKVIAYDSMQDHHYAANNQIEYVTMDYLLEHADFISLHLPLTERTHHLISYPQFAKVKETAVIVNTARGGLIDEKALLWALTHNKIWGAGIDVFEQEPTQEKELLLLDNIVIGSHCAASTFQSIENMEIMSVTHILEHLVMEQRKV